MTDEGSKFDRIFQNATPPAAEKPATADPEQQRPRQRIEKPPSAPAARPLGRPPGKRSDPAWKQFSVLLKRDTQREAAAILKAKDEGQDLSALVQSLLESWIKRQKP
jgi:hypothetical protein